MGQRAVVQVFTLKIRCAKDIRDELEGVYGHKWLSLSTVKKWRNLLVNKRIKLEDEPRLGRPPQTDLCESRHAVSRRVLILHASVCVRSLASQRLACAVCTNILGSESVISSGVRIQ
jgi:hypothetical protein